MRMVVVDRDANQELALARVHDWLFIIDNRLGAVHPSEDESAITLLHGEFYPERILPAIPEEQHEEFFKYWQAFGMTNAGPVPSHDHGRQGPQRPAMALPAPRQGLMRLVDATTTAAPAAWAPATHRRMPISLPTCLYCIP